MNRANEVQSWIVWNPSTVQCKISVIAFLNTDVVETFPSGCFVGAIDYVLPKRYQHLVATHELQDSCQNLLSQGCSSAFLPLTSSPLFPEQWGVNYVNPQVLRFPLVWSLQLATQTSCNGFPPTRHMEDAPFTSYEVTRLNLFTACHCQQWVLLDYEKERRE